MLLAFARLLRTPNCDSNHSPQSWLNSHSIISHEFLSPKIFNIQNCVIMIYIRAAETQPKKKLMKSWPQKFVARAFPLLFHFISRVWVNGTELTLHRNIVNFKFQIVENVWVWIYKFGSFCNTRPTIKCGLLLLPFGRKIFSELHTNSQYNEYWNLKRRICIFREIMYVLLQHYWRSYP